MGPIHLKRLWLQSVPAEGAPAAPPPQSNLLIAILGAELRRGLIKNAQDNGAIVIGQVDQLGFSNESAKFDQLAGSLAPFHAPIARITARYP